MKTPQIAALPGMSPLGFASPQAALRHHVSGAIERGEGVAIVEVTVPASNAALITAAPALLAALHALLATNSCREATYNSNVGLAEAVDVARAAIANAEGQETE